MIPTSRIALALLLAATGCATDGSPAGTGPGGDGDGDGDGDGPGTPPPPDMGPDYTNASWRLNNVSSTAGTLSHHGQIAFRDVAPMVAFSEPDPEDLSDQNIHTATTNGLIWTDEPRTDSLDQLAFPSLIGAGDTMVLAYNGPDADGNRAIFVTQMSGAAWSDPAELDPAAADGPARQSGEPRVVAAADGPTVLYYAWEGEPGTLPDSVEVRAQRPGGEPEVAMVADASACFDLRAVTDADGAIHAVGSCGGFFFYLTNAGGSWTVSPVELGASSPPSFGDIAVDRGGSIHIVWSGLTDCGGESCARIFYSKNLGEPMPVAEDDSASGYHPVVGVDPDGRPVLAYHRKDDGISNIYITHSADGGASFAPPRNLTPASADNNWSPSQLVFGPEGRPHLLFERIIRGSDPLDGEVVHATTP